MPHSFVLCADTPEMKKVLPDFPHPIHWDAFFIEKAGENLTAIEKTPFLPGSLSYHWYVQIPAAC